MASAAAPPSAAGPSDDGTAVTYPDVQICAMAEALGVRSPKNNSGAWINQFYHVAEQLPHAIVVSKATQPDEAAKVLLCNAAAELLTGYSRDEYIGRSTSILQEKRTEAAAVRKMRKCIADVTPVTLFVTNFRKGGSKFRNALHMKPVVDSLGKLRYWIAVLSDADNLETEGDALKALREALPSLWTDTTKKARDADELDASSWKDSMVRFTRLLWSMHWETALRRVLLTPAKSKFTQWLREMGPGDYSKLLLCEEIASLDDLTMDVASERAMMLCKQYLHEANNPSEAFADLRQFRENSIAQLAEQRFAKFASAKSSMPAAEKLLASSAENINHVNSRLVPGYEVPQDCALWLRAFMSAADTYPVCVAVSDNTIPGNNLIFVNEEFCQVTGYPRDEVLGRNCRFLQGPRTEKQSVAIIIDTLARGVDSQVKITNYRRNGTIFQNLLTMRAVHDSNGIFRFVIALWMDVTDDKMLKTKSTKMCKLLKLLPAELEVPKPSEDDAEDLACVDDMMWKAPLVKMTKEIWSTSWEGTLRHVLDHPVVSKSFRSWLKKMAADDVLQLDICREAASLGSISSPEALARAMMMCSQYLAQANTGEQALAAIHEYSTEAMEMLAERRFSRFTASAAGLGTIEKLLDAPVESIGDLFRAGYTVPEDCANWIHSFVSVSETMPCAIGLSDGTVPGWAMLYVNRELTRMTGYARKVVLGRNCSFLHGPQTEPKSVAALKEALQVGAECQMQATSYRRDGQTFQNLLTMRPLYDSNGIFRFAVFVWLDVSNETAIGLSARASRFAKLLKLLPKVLKVPEQSTKTSGDAMEKSEDGAHTREAHQVPSVGATPLTSAVL